MADANGLVEALKRAAIEAMESKKPVNVCFGKVVSAMPLKINVEQRMDLGEGQLILCRSVTDFAATVTVDWTTESGLGIHSHTVNGTGESGDAISMTVEGSDLTHGHRMAGKKVVTVHNGLDVGDEVILIRQQYGQKFIVIDRIGGGA